MDVNWATAPPPPYAELPYPELNNELKGSYAIIVGASSSLGKHLCNQLLNDIPNIKVVAIVTTANKHNIPAINNQNYGWITCEENEVQNVIDKLKTTNFLNQKCSMISFC